jgi:hypothetical protein
VGLEGCALSIVARHLPTDGHLNPGIVEPENVEAPTRSGLSKDAIRTSCLGFGDDYNEVVLATMSFGETEIKGCTSAHLVRIRGTQNADVVVLNEEVIAVIANQIAGKATREAADQARKGDFDEGLRSINLACATIQGFAARRIDEISVCREMQLIWARFS